MIFGVLLKLTIDNVFMHQKNIKNYMHQNLFGEVVEVHKNITIFKFFSKYFFQMIA